MTPSNAYLLAVALMAMTAITTEIEQQEGGEPQEIEHFDE